MGNVRGLVVILTILIFAAAESGGSITTESTNSAEVSWETLESSNTIDGSNSLSPMPHPPLQSTTNVYSSSKRHYDSTTAFPSTRESANASAPGNISSKSVATGTTKNTENSVKSTSLPSSDEITEISSINKSTTPSVLETEQTSLNHKIELTKEVGVPRQSNVPANSTSLSNATDSSATQVSNSYSTSPVGSTTESVHILNTTELTTVLLPNDGDAILSSSSGNSSTKLTTLPLNNSTDLTTSAADHDLNSTGLPTKTFLHQPNSTALNSTSTSSLSSGNPSTKLTTLPLTNSTDLTTSAADHDLNSTGLPTETFLQPNSTALNSTSASSSSSSAYPSTVLPKSSLTNITILTTPVSNSTVDSPLLVSGTEAALNSSTTELPIPFSSPSANPSTVLPKSPLTNITILTTPVSNSTVDSPLLVSGTEGALNSSTTELPIPFSSSSANSSTVLPESALTNVTDLTISILNSTAQPSPSPLSTTEASNLNHTVLSTNATLLPNSTSLNVPLSSAIASTELPPLTNVTNPTITMHPMSNSSITSNETTNETSFVSSTTQKSTVEGLENVTRTPSTSNITGSTVSSITTTEAMNNNGTTESTGVGNTTLDASTSTAAGNATSASASNSTSSESSTFSESHSNGTESQNVTTVSPLFASTTKSMENSGTVNPLTAAPPNDTIFDSTIPMSSSSSSSHDNPTNATGSSSTIVSTISSSNVSENYTPTTTSMPETTTQRLSTTSKIWKWVKSLIPKKGKNRTVAMDEKSASVMDSTENETIPDAMTSPMSAMNESLSTSSTTESTVNTTLKYSSTEFRNGISGTNTNTEITGSSHNSSSNIGNAIESSTTPLKKSTLNIGSATESSTTPSTNSTSNIGKVAESSTIASTGELEKNTTSTKPLNSTIQPTSYIDEGSKVLDSTNSSTSTFSEVPNKNATPLNASSTHQPSDPTEETSEATGKKTPLLPNYPAPLTTKPIPSRKVSMADVSHIVTTQMKTNINSETPASHLWTIAPAVAKNTTEDLVSTTSSAIDVSNTVATLSSVSRTPKAFYTPSMTSITEVPSSVIMKINPTSESSGLTHKPVKVSLPLPSTTMTPLNSTKLINSAVNDTNSSRFTTVPTINLNANSSNVVLTIMTPTNATNANQTNATSATNATEINATNVSPTNAIHVTNVIPMNATNVANLIPMNATKVTNVIPMNATKVTQINATSATNVPPTNATNVIPMNATNVTNVIPMNATNVTQINATSATNATEINATNVTQINATSATNATEINATNVTPTNATNVTPANATNVTPTNATNVTPANATNVTPTNATNVTNVIPMNATNVTQTNATDAPNFTNVTQRNVTNTTQSPSSGLTTAIGDNKTITESPMPKPTLPSIYNFTHGASSPTPTTQSAIPSANTTTVITSTTTNQSSNMTMSPESTSAIPIVTTAPNSTTSSQEMMTNSLPMTGLRTSTFNYVVNDNTTGIPCMLLNMTISMKMSYNKTDKTIGEGTLVIPENANSTGTCSEKTSQIVLMWNSTRNQKRDLQSDGHSRVFLNFVNDGSKSSLDSIVYQIYLDQKTFPNATKPTLSGNTTTGLGLFSSTVNRGHYVCNTVTDVDIGNVTITIRNVSLIAFNKDEDSYSKKEENCVTASGINMGAVIGGSVGAIIIVCLAVIYLCRRKSSSYDNSILP